MVYPHLERSSKDIYRPEYLSSYQIPAVAITVMEHSIIGGFFKGCILGFLVFYHSKLFALCVGFENLFPLMIFFWFLEQLFCSLHCFIVRLFVLPFDYLFCRSVICFVVRSFVLPLDHLFRCSIISFVVRIYFSYF